MAYDYAAQARQAIDEVFADEHGFNPHARAAIYGSAQAESGFNPTVWGDKNTSFGLFQHRGDRYEGMKNFAAQNGLDLKDPKTQALWLREELTNGAEKKWGDQLRSAQDLNSAVGAAISFERPAGWTPENPMGGLHSDKRLKFAQQYAGGGDLPMPGAEATSGTLPPGALSTENVAGGPGALFGGIPGIGVDNGQGGREWSMSEALIGAGMAMMARDNPAGAAALGKLLDKSTSDKDDKLKRTEMILKARQDANNARQLFAQRQQELNNQRWQIERQDKLDLQNQKAQEAQTKLGTAPAALYKTYDANNSLLSANDLVSDRISQAKQDIKEGRLDVSWIGKAEDTITELMNKGDPESVAKANALTNYQWLTKNAANNVLQAAKGAQTEGDAVRAQALQMPGFAGWNNKTAFSQLGTMQDQINSISDATIRSNETMAKRFGASFDPEEEGRKRSSYSARLEKYKSGKQDDDDFINDRNKYGKKSEGSENIPEITDDEQLKTLPPDVKVIKYKGRIIRRSQ